MVELANDSIIVEKMINDFFFFRCSLEILT